MASHSGIADASHPVPKRFWILLVCAVLAIGLGWYGHLYHPQGVGECLPHAHLDGWVVIEALFKALALFHFEHAGASALAACHSWPLIFAAFLAPATLVVTIGTLLWHFLKERQRDFALWRARNHRVMVGYGAKGRARAQEQTHEGWRVVAIDLAPTEAATVHAREHGVILVGGDARDPRVLARARIARASSVMVATGDDARNIGLARAIVARMATGGGRNVHASVGNPLVRRALTTSEIPASIDIFSTEEFAAHSLCDMARFFEIADLMGQDRVHIVIVGFGPLTIHLTAQILRTSITAGFATPAVTILCSRPAEAANTLHLAFPGAANNVRILSYDPLTQPLDDDALMNQVDKTGPITAVVTPGEGSADPIANALAVREAGRRSGRWRAPVFFATEMRSDFVTLEHPLATTKRYGDVLQPFDTSAALCTARRTRERDRISRAIHERFLHYQKEERARGATPSGTEAMKGWDDVGPTYRQANRRAADHVAAKLASAGCFVPRGDIVLSFDPAHILDTPLFEVLADLEHDAWAMDRRLDGWRLGPVRDNPSRIHDLLVPYAQLQEKTKALDRDQIRALLAKSLRRAPRESFPNGVRFDLWIGLIGTTNVAGGDATRITEEIAQIIGRILQARPDHHITLLSPLAPGADLIATRKALAVLEAARRPHRLLVPNVVRHRDVVDSFEGRWRRGALATLDGPSGGEWAEAHAGILKEIEALIAHQACEREIELDRLPLQTDEAQRQRGYQLQNAYIVERAHVVIAAVKGEGPIAPGGTAEAIQWRRDSQSIPGEFRRYRSRPNPLGAGIPDLFTIDLNAPRAENPAHASPGIEGRS